MVKDLQESWRDSSAEWTGESNPEVESYSLKTSDHNGGSPGREEATVTLITLRRIGSQAICNVSSGGSGERFGGLKGKVKRWRWMVLNERQDHPERQQSRKVEKTDCKLHQRAKELVGQSGARL